MRPEVTNLVSKGILPSSSATIEQIAEWQQALEKITPPVSDEEAEALITLFPAIEDDCYGLIWTLIHLVESAPHLPLKHCLQHKANPWLASLLRRSEARFD